jgi:ribosome-associated protein
VSNQQNLLEVTASIRIPLDEFEFSYARSGGPGGQNVNKVNSKAILRWNVSASPSLPPLVRARFLMKFGSRLTSDGELVISSQTYRDQVRNVDECLEKVRQMIAEVAITPKQRKPTKPSKAAKRERVDSKRKDSNKKQQRRRPAFED